ncbi:reverse transcriptase domain-containing protein [Tanacetum coccineum]
MEELCQPTMNGRGGPIAPVNIQAMDFRLKNHMIQQVQQSCQYHGLPSDNSNKHIDKFLIVTQSMKQNGVTHDILRLCLFPYSLTHHATAWFYRLLKNSIHSWEEMVTKFLSIYFPPSMVTKLRNDINTFYNGLTLRHRDTINAAAGGTFMKRRPEEFARLVVVYITIPSVKPPVALLKGTYMVLRETTMREVKKGGFQSERLAQGLESVRYGISNVLDTKYWGFLRVGTTFDIF